MRPAWQDIRYAARTLAKTPSFALITIITIALGIGANTTIFSLVNSMLLRPLPGVQDASRLAAIGYRQGKGTIQSNFSFEEYRDLRDQATGAFSDVVAEQMGFDGLAFNGKPDRILDFYVSGNFFSSLGIKPALGRLIRPGEGEVSGADPVIVISYAYWKSRFGGDPGVIGEQVRVNGRTFTIIGVTPKGFSGTAPVASGQVYMPLAMAVIEGLEDITTNRAIRNFTIYARLKPEATLATANSELAVIGGRWSRDHPVTDKDFRLSAYPERRGRLGLDEDNTIAVLSSLFLALAVMVLLLACVNVGNLLLVRAMGRERDTAIRLALGAGRARLIRLMLAECMLLAFAGGAIGVGLGLFGSARLGSIDLQIDFPIQFDSGFDWNIFLFSFACALATAIVVGLAPAVRIARGNLNNILHEGGRGVVGVRRRLRTVLVMAQVAGSLTLLIVAGLFTRSLLSAQNTNLGFDPDHVLNLTTDPVFIGYKEAQGVAFYKDLLTRVRALPGVESATIDSAVPLGYYGNAETILIGGDPLPASEAPPTLAYNATMGDYMSTLRIGIARGRDLRDSDNETAPYVAVINESMAKKYWPKQDPIGRRFQFASDRKHWITIVGIARNSRFASVTGAIGPFFYAPLAQHYGVNALATLQVRTAGPPESMALVIRRLIANLSPDLPVFDVHTMTQALLTLQGLLPFRLGAGLAAALGSLGLILAIVGVYGVVSFDAAQKTHEIGVRLALGAGPSTILAMVLRQGLWIVVIGVVAGVGAALAAGRVVGAFLAISPSDPLTYAAVSVVLAFITLLAVYIPARRAMRVDAMVALRHE